MTKNAFIVAHCGQFDLQIDLKKLTILQTFLDKKHPDRLFQLSMLEVLSFLDVIDKYNTERARVIHGDVDPQWCFKLLRYIEGSYLVKEINQSQLPA